MTDPTNPIDELRERGVLPEVSRWLKCADRSGDCHADELMRRSACDERCAPPRGHVIPTPSHTKVRENANAALESLAALALGALKRAEKAEEERAELLAASLDAAQDNVRLRAERSALKVEVERLKREREKDCEYIMRQRPSALRSDGVSTRVKAVLDDIVAHRFPGEQIAVVARRHEKDKP
jgi:hypothetical protein